MSDRSSRPHRKPAKTSEKVTKRVVSLRLWHRLGPVQLAPLVGLPPSTVHRVLVRCRVNQLSPVDRATGQPVRRFEHDRPGAMLYVDVRQCGNIPDGGGWRFVGRWQGERNRSDTSGRAGRGRRQPRLGHAFVHTVIDDHSRVAYAEVHDDETAVTAVAVLRRAVAWYADRGVITQRVLSDNGGAYRSFLWRDACRARDQAHPRPALPATDQRQDRTLPPHLVRRLGLRPLLPIRERTREALPTWLHRYNHHRPHTACGNKLPAR